MIDKVGWIGLDARPTSTPTTWRKGGKGELEEWRPRPHSPRMGGLGLRSEAVHYIRRIVVRQEVENSI